MNRTKITQRLCQQVKNLLEWSPSSCSEPTAKEMANFASQFSQDEWTSLCDDENFLFAIQADIEEACVLASDLLEREVFSTAKLLKV
jgi:hypothetical protein